MSLKKTLNLRQGPSFRDLYMLEAIAIPIDFLNH